MGACDIPAQGSSLKELWALSADRALKLEKLVTFQKRFGQTIHASYTFRLEILISACINNSTY